MTDLQKIKAAPDRVATQEMEEGKVARIVWSSQKLGLQAIEIPEAPVGGPQTRKQGKGEVTHG